MYFDLPHRSEKTLQVVSSIQGVIQAITLLWSTEDFWCYQLFSLLQHSSLCLSYGVGFYDEDATSQAAIFSLRTVSNDPQVRGRRARINMHPRNLLVQVSI